MLLFSPHIVTFSCPPLPTPSPPLPNTDGDETALPPTTKRPQQETSSTPPFPSTTQETQQKTSNTPPPTSQRPQQPDIAEPPTITNSPFSSNDGTKPSYTITTIFGTSEIPDVPVQNSVGNITTLLVALAAGSMTVIVFVAVVALIIVCVKRRKYNRVATDSACGVAFHEHEHSEDNSDCLSLQDVEVKHYDAYATNFPTGIEIKHNEAYIYAINHTDAIEVTHNDATDTIDSDVNHSDVNPADANEDTYSYAYATNPINANVAVVN